MVTLTTPLATIMVHDEGERALEQALQTGECYNFKMENGDGPVYFAGTIRRSAISPSDFVLDIGKTANS